MICMTRGLSDLLQEQTTGSVLMLQDQTCHGDAAPLETSENPV